MHSFYNNVLHPKEFFHYISISNYIKGLSPLTHAFHHVWDDTRFIQLYTLHYQKVTPYHNLILFGTHVNSNYTIVCLNIKSWGYKVGEVSTCNLYSTMMEKTQKDKAKEGNNRISRKMQQINVTLYVISPRVYGPFKVLS